MTSNSFPTQTVRGGELARHYRDVRARLYGPRPVMRRPKPPEPIVVLPILDGRSLADVPAEPQASTPCPLNMLAAPSWRFLVAYTALKHRVGKDQILSPFRGRQVAIARAEAIHLARTHVPGIGLSRLGLYFDRDHTTILSALRRYEERKTQQQQFPLSPVFTAGEQNDASQVQLGNDQRCPQGVNF